jgi:hypothetical protein
MRAILIALVVSLPCAACVGSGDGAHAEDLDAEGTRAGRAGAAAGEEAADNAAPNAELRALATMDALAMRERTGAAPEASTAGDTCVAACAAGYAALCLRVRAICEAAEVVTIGGATVECAAALAVACIGGAALGAICGRRCPP